MRQLSAVLIAVVLMSISCAAHSEERADTPYAVEGSGFTIKYPAKWKKQEGDHGSPAVRFSTPDGAAFVDVEILDMNQNFDFTSFMRLEVMSAKKRTDYKELDNGEIAIAGHKAKKYIFSYTETKDVSGVIASYYLFKGKKPSGYLIYKITGVCRNEKYDALKNTIEDIATNFEFEK
jgi:hypothetical protein